MFFQNTPVHNNHEAGVQRTLSSSAINYTFLQPDRPGPKADCFINRGARFIRSSKYIYQIEALRNGGQIGIRFFSKHCSFVWVNRNDLVTILTHVSRDAVRRAKSIRRKSDDCDAVTLVEYFADVFGIINRQAFSSLVRSDGVNWNSRRPSPPA